MKREKAGRKGTRLNKNNGTRLLNFIINKRETTRDIKILYRREKKEMKFLFDENYKFRLSLFLREKRNWIFNFITGMIK